jgi:hypothetical protein
MMILRNARLRRNRAQFNGKLLENGFVVWFNTTRPRLAIESP